MAELDGTDEYFDSRDVIARIAEIEADYTGEFITDDTEIPYTDMPSDVYEEYETFRGLRDEAEINIADWYAGATFVADEYFETYARELAEDIGAVRDTGWPYDHIDWVSAASELKQDYTGFLFRGTMYWAR